MIVKLDSVERTNGESVDLAGRREFKGNPHTIRMGVAMAIAGAIYLPAAPLFLISRGRDRTVLKGTEVTAYTKDDTWLATGDLPATRATSSELADMIRLLPPRSLCKSSSLAAKIRFNMSPSRPSPFNRASGLPESSRCALAADAMEDSPVSDALPPHPWKRDGHRVRGASFLCPAHRYHVFPEFPSARQKLHRSIYHRDAR